jgi:hypothetical protein
LSLPYKPSICHPLFATRCRFLTCRFADLAICQKLDSILPHQCYLAKIA